MYIPYKREFVTFFLSITLLLQPIILNADDEIILPDIGDPSGRIITPVQEKALGKAFYRNLHSHIRINRDPEIRDFIQSLGHRLAAKSDDPKRAFHFFVVLEPVVNAFAGPGGFIGVNAGLILRTESESELAAVLAHEIAHVTQRHLNRAFEAASRMTVPLAAATLAAILIGSQSAEAGQAALIALQAGSTQYQINFTRDNEEEADRVGLHILARADLDPRSMPVFFERLQQSSRYYGRNIPEFLRTHPVTASRIADTRGRSEKFPYRQYPDSFEYQLTKAKLHVLTSSSPQSAVKFFKPALKQGTAKQQTVAQYGLALAYSDSGQHQKANTIFQALTKKYPAEPRIASAMGQSIFKSGNFRKAITFYQKAIRNFPHNHAITLGYTESLLQSGQPKKALDNLKAFTKRQSPTPEIYELLAQAYETLGNKAESHRYIAEYYYQTGQTRSAITQLNIAQRAAKNNNYLIELLDSRKKLFEEEEKERKELKIP